MLLIAWLGSINPLADVSIDVIPLSYRHFSCANYVSGVICRDLNFNQLDWVIEDETSKGKVFSGLVNLTELGLRGNRIRSISSVAFAPLKSLRSLDLSLNPVASVQDNPFNQMKVINIG